MHIVLDLLVTLLFPLLYNKVNIDNTVYEDD